MATMAVSNSASQLSFSFWKAGRKADG